MKAIIKLHSKSGKETMAIKWLCMLTTEGFKTIYNIKKSYMKNSLYSTKFTHFYFKSKSQNKIK